MVSNLQHYPYATITNKTPYATHQYLLKWSGVDVYYASTKICSVDYINEGIASGGKWTASSRGVCLITIITAVIALPSLPDGLVCDSYQSSGTSYSQFAIIMDGDDACRVVRVVK